MKKVLAGLCVASMATFSGAVFAAETGFYGAVDLGQSDYAGGCAGLPAGMACDAKPTSYRLAGGYDFSKNLGVEASYTDYGNATASGVVLGVPVTAQVGVTAFQLVGTGTLPLNDAFSLTAKAGLAVSTTKASASGAGAAASASANDTALVWGIGAQYNFTQSVGIRVNYEDLGNLGDPATTGSAKLSNISAGVVFKF